MARCLVCGLSLAGPFAECPSCDAGGVGGNPDDWQPPAVSEAADELGGEGAGDTLFDEEDPDDDRERPAVDRSGGAGADLSVVGDAVVSGAAIKSPTRKGGVMVTMTPEERSARARKGAMAAKANRLARRQTNGSERNGKRGPRGPYNKTTEKSRTVADLPATYPVRVSEQPNDPVVDVLEEELLRLSHEIFSLQTQKAYVESLKAKVTERTAG